MNRQINIFNYSFKNQSGASSFDIYIDGEIVDASTQEILREYWGDETSVSYKSLRDSINLSGADTFNIYINSGGGHVGDAMAIHDMLVQLQRSGKRVNTYVRGICASAATYIAMASDNAEISENSWFMIHNVSGFIWGDVNVIENYARTMRKFNDKIVGFYSKKTGLSETVIENLMNKETWLTAAEAVEKGFIQSETESAVFSNAIQPEMWPYQNRDVLTCYNSFTKPKNSSEMNLKQIETAVQNGVNKVLESIGLKDKAENADVKTAIKNLSDDLTSAVKEAVGNDRPSDEHIESIVNKVLEARTQEDAEAIEAAITARTENFVSADSLKEQLSSFSATIIKDLGGKSGDRNDPPAPKISAKNRFTGRQWFKGDDE